MQLKVQLVVCADDGREEHVQEMVTFEKDCQRIEHLGLTLTEAKQLLATLQQHLVAQQAATFVAAQAQCDQCGATLQRKGQHTRTSLARSRCPVHACIIVPASVTQPRRSASSPRC